MIGHRYLLQIITAMNPWTGHGSYFCVNILVANEKGYIHMLYHTYLYVYINHDDGNDTVKHHM